jgi:hypothetical protein
MSTQAASSRNSPAGQPKSSASWVNYQHGVNLAEAIEPGSSKRMTWEDLIAYPGKLNGQAVSPEQALLIAATRVGPALEWAAANGILPEKTSYAQSEVHTALSSLDKHQESLAGAITNLVAPLPMRKDYFTGWQMVSPIKGHNDPNNKKYKVAAYNDKQFGEDFKDDLVNKKAAYGVVIKQLISLLPVNDRIAIEHGQVELYALKPPGTGDDPARDVVLIKAVHNGKTTAYEVNPQLGIARQRVDLEALFIGNSVIGRNKLPDGTDEKEFTVWKKPNIQGRRYGPKVDNEHPEKPNNQPFSSSIYTLKLLGEFPASPASANENTVPNTLSSKRFSDVANTVSSQLFYAKDIDLLNVAQKDEARVSPEEKEDLENYQEFSASRDNRREFLKGFVPFWQGVEAIIAGRPIEGIAKIWIDILSFMMPVDKVVGGLVKGGIRLIKPVLPEFAKLSTNFGSYTLKSGMAGVKWEGGVQGLKWAQKVPQNLAKAAEQFKLNSTPLLKAGSAVREIEFKGASYFVANKPDAGDGVHYLLRVPDPKDPSKLVSSSIVAKPNESGVWSRRAVEGGGPGYSKVAQADPPSVGNNAEAFMENLLRTANAVPGSALRAKSVAGLKRADFPVPARIYRAHTAFGDSTSTGLRRPAGTTTSGDDYLAAILKHTARQGGSAGEVMSFSTSKSKANNFSMQYAKDNLTAPVFTVDTTLDPSAFRTVPDIILKDGERLVAQGKITKATLLNAADKVFNYENEVFYVKGDVPASFVVG